MADPTPEIKIKLNILVEGDDPFKRAFEVTVSLRDKFCNVSSIIQEAYRKSEQISIYGLELYKANVSCEQAGEAKLSDETLLHAIRRVASEWPSGLDIDEDSIHIIVRTTSRQVTNKHRAVAPPLAKIESEKLIKQFNDAQSSFVQEINETSSSPQDFRSQQNGPNYINIGRPDKRVWLPIVLYYLVFDRFLTGLRSADAIDDKVYPRTWEHFYVSQSLCDPSEVRDSLRRLLHNTFQNTAKDEADNIITGSESTCIMIIEITEDGLQPSDPSIRAAQTYTRYWSKNAIRRWLNWCCCPSILVALTGPWMCVFGAIFLDRPVTQPLTDLLWVGDNQAKPSESDYMARVFDSLARAGDELMDYYHTSSPPLSGSNPARPFPYLTHYLDSMGQVIHFIYRKSLCPDSPIFLAETIDEENPKPIIVKFVQSYNGDTHKLLAENGLAPELLYNGTMYPDEQPGPWCAMVVMGFVRGGNLEHLTHSRLSHSTFNDVKTAVDLLHGRDFVFGNLCKSSVMVLQEATGRAMLIGFDGCGKDHEGRYPLNMNMKPEWHQDVGPGAVMDK